MKLQTLIFAICLLFTAPACVGIFPASDFQENWTAYESGNYKGGEAYESDNYKGQEAHESDNYEEVIIKWLRQVAEQGYAYAIYALEYR